MARIETRCVTRNFGGGTNAVDSVSIDAADGEFVVLVGPSGCGKTTTLRMVAGLEMPNSGSIHIDDNDVTKVMAKDRNLATVFQSYALYPHMTVAENIGFALRLQGVNRSDVAQAVQRAADRLEIAPLLDRRPRQLSGGQRQRVAVARAIIREPKAFLFDEPLSNLDAKLRASARQEISLLQRALGVTTLYVTHDQVEAMTMADRIVIMHEGKVRQIGASLALYNDPADSFVAGFLGSPPMNLISGVAMKKDFGTVVQLGPLEIPAPPQLREGDAQVGMRAEAIEFLPNNANTCTAGVQMTGTVLHVERLGHECLVDVQIAGGGTLTIRIPGAVFVHPGDSTRLWVPDDAIYIFDASGNRVRPE